MAILLGNLLTLLSGLIPTLLLSIDVAAFLLSNSVAALFISSVALLFIPSVALLFLSVLGHLPLNSMTVSFRSIMHLILHNQITLVLGYIINLGFRNSVANLLLHSVALLVIPC